MYEFWKTYDYLKKYLYYPKYLGDFQNIIAKEMIISNKKRPKNIPIALLPAKVKFKINA